ncbi:YbaB/EbfC family nucleoid-associated protein [Nocardia sp. NPDC052278]|uniref:YbaB/EbfC family nucleoid-associated protein n=1 Tax=unclassified Nocardia TaxID=2637762 RepID=UPI0036C58B20
MTEANFGYLTDVSVALDALRSHAERMLELSERICAIQVEETSPDGAATVIVDGEGRLVDIRLAHGISRLTPTEFGQCLVDTSRAAARRAVEKQAALVAAFNNTDADSSDSS